MNYSKIYHDQALAAVLPPEKQSGEIAWRSPSNIALVKYWGKRSPQLPTNPSISFTLQNAYTETSIQYLYDPGMQETQLSYTFEGEENSFFSKRIRKYLDTIQKYLPFLCRLKLTISSSNSFPHSAGIASSASAFSALALCLVDIEARISGNVMEEQNFFRKASFLARLGSGSASRSVFGGAVLWGETHDNSGSSDEYALDISNSMHPAFASFQDTILILNDGTKEVSSSFGHALMANNPYSDARVIQAKKHISALGKVLANGSMEEFVTIIESEALALHAMMLTSEPGYILLNAETLEVISRTRKFRSERKIPLGFTLDAGPNIHLLYPAKFQKEVREFVEDKLIQLCQEGRYISDCIGSGPARI